jgi:hypothetical protein
MSCYENAKEYIKGDTTATPAPGLLLIFCTAILLKHSAAPYLQSSDGDVIKGTWFQEIMTEGFKS